MESGGRGRAGVYGAGVERGGGGAEAVVAVPVGVSEILVGGVADLGGGGDTVERDCVREGAFAVCGEGRGGGGAGEHQPGEGDGECESVLWRIYPDTGGDDEESVCVVACGGECSAEEVRVVPEPGGPGAIPG